MIELNLINQSQARLPRQFLQSWVKAIVPFLSTRDRQRLKSKQLTVVFLDSGPARALNFEFRDRDYATDVLSFVGEGELLGELALCPEVIARQAKEHGLTVQAELAYMVLHGILHLLGYDHETNDRDAKKMFRLQDRVFEGAGKKMGLRRR